ERTQHRGEPRELLVDADGVVIAQRGDECGRIERRPMCRKGRARNDGASPTAEVAQFIVAEAGHAPDAVSFFNGAVEEPQARDVGFRVHPAAIVTGRRNGPVAALPGTQRVDTDTGQLGDGADRITRRTCGWPAHRAAIRTATAAAADASVPHDASATVSTNGHWRSVE